MGWCDWLTGLRARMRWNHRGSKDSWLNGRPVPRGRRYPLPAMCPPNSGPSPATGWPFSVSSCQLPARLGVRPSDGDSAPSPIAHRPSPNAHPQSSHPMGLRCQITASRRCQGWQILRRLAHGISPARLVALPYTYPYPDTAGFDPRSHPIRPVLYVCTVSSGNTTAAIVPAGFSNPVVTFPGRRLAKN